MQVGLALWGGQGSKDAKSRLAAAAPKFGGWSAEAEKLDAKMHTAMIATIAVFDMATFPEECASITCIQQRSLAW